MIVKHRFYLKILSNIDNVKNEYANYKRIFVYSELDVYKLQEKRITLLITKWIIRKSQ